MWVHYCLAIVYFILLFMTIWSYMAARCCEPGFGPRDAKSYNDEKLPAKERMLWDYLKRHGAFKQLQADLVQQQAPDVLISADTAVSPYFVYEEREGDREIQDV